QRNRELRPAATLRAAELYTGVLYDALRLPELLAGRSAALVEESVLIFSGLWGVLRPTDAVPPYRLSMGVSLPPLGGLGVFWRSRLGEVLTKLAEGRLVVDCRSTAYATAFRPGPAVAARTVTVRVLRQTVVDGTVRRSVVSHMAKAARGAVAHSLLAAGASPRTPGELATALADLGHRVELTAPARGGGPHVLNVVVPG
ncbi:YaaA family protein, partial [Thermobifida halotolerans]|uniref:YaaA family protein n=1 Tax=Thermobifida halotolerans TaxID=483545 RepID=UPI000837C221